jgi:hypothetical protein
MKDCTCTGTCRGPEGLGDGWVCVLQKEKPVSHQTEYYWWCERCYAEKSQVQVTYKENCTRCGEPVEWKCDDQPTA